MSMLFNRIQQLELLKKGKGIKYLLKETYKILGNPVFMFDTDYNLIANTESITTDDTIWNEIITGGAFSNETLDIFREEGFIDAVANAKTITFLVSDRIKYDRILGKIFNKNNTYVANLVIVECDRAFQPDDTIVFEAVCKLFSNEISANNSYQDYEKTYQENLIKKLLDKSIIDKELYAARMAILYNGLKTNLYVAVADVAQCDPAYEKLARLRDSIRHIQPEFKYAVYANYIIIIISSEHTKLDQKRDLNKLNRFFRKKHISAGISSCFENAYELPKYYAEAIEALRFGLTSHSGPQTFLYDDME